ncbi:MAG TPA: hypothetical protein VG826_34660 [Pirellulales bacterium]|nr:hypothetical protein [Pirellulales bacterium]
MIFSRKTKPVSKATQHDPFCLATEINHPADHFLGQSHHASGLPGADAFEHLNFQKTVARIECAALINASLERAIADVLRRCSVQPVTSLGVLDVALDGELASDQPWRPSLRQRAKFAGTKTVLAAPADTGGDPPK